MCPPFLLIMRTPRTEFAQALKAISTERGLEADVILDTIKQAIIAAYRRDAKEQGDDTEGYEFDVELDSVSGEARIYSWPEGEEKKRKDVTPPGFGRIAAQTAKQVIHQKIREAEKSSIMDEFSDRVGSLVSGTILRFDGPNVRVDMGRTEGTMPAEERVPDEHLVANQRMTFLLKDIEEGLRGKEIVLSRADPEFVKKLFAREVPEVSSGSVEIKRVAREPGVRSKIAVFSNQSGVDPVGSCVGQKGVRVKAVTDELGERVDIIPWSEDASSLVKASLSPAEGLSVSLDEKTKTAKVKTTEDQLSLAIGKDGQNARLASVLTGWRIEVGGTGPSKESEEQKGKKEPKKKTKAKAEKVKDSAKKPGEKKEVKTKKVTKDTKSKKTLKSK